MSKTTKEVLDLIESDSPDATPEQVLRVLEDGSARVALGITDDDQFAVILAWQTAMTLLLTHPALPIRQWS